eukprot:PhF_6_TR40356/c0_g1_i1/m.60048
MNLGELFQFSESVSHHFSTEFQIAREMSLMSQYLLAIHSTIQEHMLKDTLDGIPTFLCKYEEHERHTRHVLEQHFLTQVVCMHEMVRVHMSEAAERIVLQLHLFHQCIQVNTLIATQVLVDIEMVRRVYVWKDEEITREGMFVRANVMEKYLDVLETIRSDELQQRKLLYQHHTITTEILQMEDDIEFGHFQLFDQWMWCCSADMCKFEKVVESWKVGRNEPECGATETKDDVYALEELCDTCRGNVILNEYNGRWSLVSTYVELGEGILRDSILVHLFETLLGFLDDVVRPYYASYFNTTVIEINKQIIRYTAQHHPQQHQLMSPTRLRCAAHLRNAELPARRPSVIVGPENLPNTTWIRIYAVEFNLPVFHIKLPTSPDHMTESRFLAALHVWMGLSEYHRVEVQQPIGMVSHGTRTLSELGIVHGSAVLVNLRSTSKRLLSPTNPSQSSTSSTTWKAIENVFQDPNKTSTKVCPALLWMIRGLEVGGGPSSPSKKKTTPLPYFEDCVLQRKKTSDN